jgi:hypothetical protein
MHDLIGPSYKFCGLVEPHVSVSASLSDFVKKREKAFFRLVKDYNVISWNLNLAILLKRLKFTSDKFL